MLPFLASKQTFARIDFLRQGGRLVDEKGIHNVKFLAENCTKRRLSHICTHGNGTENMYLFCRYKPFVLPLQTVCTVTTNLLFCRYKPFVLSLQAVCTVATSRLYCRYKPFVLSLQAACSAPPCQKAHCKGLPLMWPKLVYVRIMDSKQ